MRTIKVIPYDPKWKEEFQKAHAFFTELLKDLDVQIEHVGSTSVEGLAAKPILDIDIIVPNQEESQKVIHTLGTVGYQHRGNLGIPGREAFHYDPANPHITWMEHHLYVCLEDCESVTNHFLLRAYLRKHPEAAAAYGKLKIELAKKYPHDIDAYVEAKTGLITSFLSASGMDEDALSRITDVNKKR